MADVGAEAEFFMIRVQLVLTIGIAMNAIAHQSALAAKENIEESRVPAYELPDPLIAANGEMVKSAAEWTSKRRPEILRLFETEVYGKAPAEKPELHFHVDSEDCSAL